MNIAGATPSQDRGQVTPGSQPRRKSSTTCAGISHGRSTSPPLVCQTFALTAAVPPSSSA